MIEYIGIIVGSICLLALGIIGYFLYNRINTQQTTIEQMIMRQRSMEAVIFRPPPKQEIKSLYGKTTTATEDDCDNCSIKPFTEIMKTLPPLTVNDNSDDKSGESVVVEVKNTVSPEEERK